MSTLGRIEPGGRFGDLEIEAEIGAGAFGVVYRAKDALVGRTVALKVLRSAGMDASAGELRRLFLNEIHAHGPLVHPNIATLYHVHALEDGGFVLELEFVDGLPLEAALADGARLSATEAIDLARGMAAGLRAAHAAGVVHGDVKPANVLRARDGTVKLVDFGLARTLGTRSGRHSTESFAGTPHYAAPEIVEGGRHSAASDVWGLGVTLHRALSGRLPFDAATMAGLFFRVLNAEPEPLPDDVPGPLASLVRACLAKKPEARPALDDAFLAALDRRRVPRAEPAATAPKVGDPAPTLVGREVELARLREALGRTAQGATGVLAVTGAAGIGKTRLVACLSDEARTRGFHALHAVVTSNEGLLRPMHRALLATSGTTGADGPASGTTDPGSRDRRPTVAHVADVERRLTTLATDRAVLFVVEDLHRASNEDARMLGRLAARLEGAPVLLLVTERTPDLDATEGARPRFEAFLGERGERIDLGPMPREALHRLLEDATGASAPTALVERAVARADGNPLFAIHMLSHSLESRASSASGGGISRGGASVAEPPPILRELMVRRLRHVPEGLREVLDAAAVEGDPFEADAVATALAIPPLDVLRRLQRLARIPGLVVPLEHGYRFAHPLLQETVYAEVAPDLRRVLHRAYADALEASGADVDPERLGAHWERAGERARAAPHLLEAARRAAERLEYWRCLDLATRAGLVPGTMGDEFVTEHAAALLDVANVLGEVGRAADRDALFDDLARVATSRADRVLGLRVDARRGLSRFLGSGLLEGDEARLAEAAERLPDSIDRGIAWYALGLVEKSRQRPGGAEAAFQRADAQFVGCGATGRHGSALDQLGSLAGGAGELRRAEALFREAARVCRDAGRSVNAEISETNAILTQVDLGTIDGTADRLVRAARLVDADGGRVPAARIRVRVAEILYATGDLPAARAVIDRAAATLGEIGMKAGVVEACWTGAELAIATDDADGSGELIRLGRSAANALASASKVLRFDGLDVLRELALGDEALATAAARRVVGECASLEPGGLASSALPPLIEATALGLDVAIVEPIARAFLAASSPEGAAPRVVRAVVEGSRALEARDPAGIERAAAELERRDVGLRRALWHALAAAWRAVAAQRRGARGEGVRRAEDALRAADGLGHRPIGRRVRQLVSGLVSAP